MGLRQAIKTVRYLDYSTSVHHLVSLTKYLKNEILVSTPPLISDTFLILIFGKANLTTFF